MNIKINNNKTKKTVKIRQLHLMLWMVIIIAAIPITWVGSTLIHSIKEQSSPVAGERFKEDMPEKIEQSQIDEVVRRIKELDHVEDVTANLLSATLRIHINCADDITEKQMQAMREKVYNDIMKDVLPTKTYFTNTEDSKSYDFEIDFYNYIPDEEAGLSADKQIYLKMVKNGKEPHPHTDNMTKAKDPDLVKEIVR